MRKWQEHDLRMLASLVACKVFLLAAILAYNTDKVNRLSLRPTRPSPEGTVNHRRQNYQSAVHSTLVYFTITALRVSEKPGISKRMK